jgi:hypothetical protein
MSSLFVRIALCIVLLGVAGEARGDDWMDNLDQGMDNLDQALRVNLFNGSVTAQLSGLMDIEGYYIQQPPTGLYSTNGNFLFNPRLTLNLDVEITPAIYGFVEARVDRGFDPSNGDIDTRFDQYGISYKPRSDNPFRIQVGKFSSVVGTYSEREDSWANPFVNAPLPYENLTGISSPIMSRRSTSSRRNFSEQYGGISNFLRRSQSARERARNGATIYGV